MKMVGVLNQGRIGLFVPGELYLSHFHSESDPQILGRFLSFQFSVPICKEVSNFSVPNPLHLKCFVISIGTSDLLF